MGRLVFSDRLVFWRCDEKDFVIISLQSVVRNEYERHVLREGTSSSKFSVLSSQFPTLRL